MASSAPREPARVALVTGGGRGLGRAIARRLAEGGTTPVVTYHTDRETAADTAANLRARTPDAEAVHLDLADPDGIARVVEGVLRSHGRLDVLVNNAFTWARVPHKLHELPVEAWNHEIARNLTGSYLVTRAVLPAMLEQGYGRIVFVGSLAMRGEPGRGPYVAAKMALLGLVRTLAREYAGSGITANMVSPGYIAAGQFERLDEAVRERALRSVPMRRKGQAAEVAEAVWYFTTPAAGYTTGQQLGVDGGAP